MKSVDTTPRQRHERARRKAMGLAMVQRPLRRITEKLGEFHSTSVEAQHAADAGDGQRVQLLARQFI